MTAEAARDLLERLVMVAKQTLDPEVHCNVPSTTWMDLRREARAPSNMHYRVIDDADDVLVVTCHNVAMAREDGDEEAAVFWIATARPLLARCEGDLRRIKSEAVS